MNPPLFDLTAFLFAVLAAAGIGLSALAHSAVGSEGTSSAGPDKLDQLRADLIQASAAAEGTVGVAVSLLGGDEQVVLEAEGRFPMQSVFKLPLAMAVLAEVDRGGLALGQVVEVSPADFVSSRQHSPIRDRYPEGVTLSLAELIEAAAGGSDGTAADVLLDLVGGPAAVTAFLRELGIDGVMVSVTEKDMGRDSEAQYQNWSTPSGALALLRALDEARGLSRESHALLIQVLTDTWTGATRIKAHLPEITSVAHKTGSSRTVDGIAAATNNIGLITLPDGRRLAVAVFVSESRADFAVRERVIADLAKLAFDFWAWD